MIRLGEIQILSVARITSVGTYLKSKDNQSYDSVLLPLSQVPAETQIGDEIQVFVYRDSSDRLIATTKEPKLTIGQTAELEVIGITKIGAFMDWGLEKDLFLPFKEQTCKIEEGKKYLVGLYADKSNRLCATMDVYYLLDSSSPYKENDRVTGIIYSIKNDIGAFVAVDNQYHGLIPFKEWYGDYQCGDKIEARVTHVREDGKLDLALREKAYIQMDKDTLTVLEKLNQNKGFLSLNDDSDPEIIKEQLQMSKRAYKRATGRLLKENKIKMTDEGIELINK